MLTSDLPRNSECPLSSLRSAFLKGCILEGTGGEQLILKSGQMPHSDLVLPLHHHPAVFTTWSR